MARNLYVVLSFYLHFSTCHVLNMNSFNLFLRILICIRYCERGARWQCLYRLDNLEVIKWLWKVWPSNSVKFHFFIEHV